MRRAAGTFAAVWAAALLLAAPAGAEFGFKDLDVAIVDPESGAEVTQAGSHDFEIVTTLEVNTRIHPELVNPVPFEQVKDLRIELPLGFVAAPTATERCSTVEFATLIDDNPIVPACSDNTVIGRARVRVDTGSGPLQLVIPVYNLVPPPGVLARFGFLPTLRPVLIDAGLEEIPPYTPFASLVNVTQTVRFFESEVSIWGNPYDSVYDDQRGVCGIESEIAGFPGLLDFLDDDCPAEQSNVPFLTLPRSCSGPLSTSFEARSWERPGTWISDRALTPPGMTECAKLGFSPRISSRATTTDAEAPSGLDFNLQIDDEELLSPEGIADSDIKEAEIAFPEGMTLNPSQAEGLGVCSESDFARETAGSEFGRGCPPSSKVGTVEAESPLLEGEIAKGSVFVAEPFENRFGSLIAVYLTVKIPERGVAVNLAGKVEPDPETGQIEAIFRDLPQIPISDFRVHLREGGRSPLVTPRRCGTHTTEARFTPWANPSRPFTTTASFEVSRGVGGGPCPPGGTPPFEPGFAAGSLNNDAGAFSPFFTRLTRRDGDQDLTRLDTTLPPGLVGKLAGVSRCSEAQIARARAKTGKAELASPSCPANSRVGGVTGGAGVGSQLTYVPGSLYLAGPFGGEPFSLVSIVPAVAGPFDVGTIVTRFALRVDSRSAQVTVDGAASEPIPHILAGIPLRVRDLRASVDRPGFALNPTSCAPKATAALIWGGGADLFSTADDAPVARSAYFQAANCASLGFRPRLGLRLRGGTGRGAHPSLRAVLRPRAGDANLRRAVVRLPRSAFLEQAHIRTICTRVQFAAERCPRGAIYGRVRAFTPLLDQPLEGPVYLRSSNNELPDVVFDLHGAVDFEAVGRIDSIRGGIRATFAGLPDAPISRVVLRMQGGKKGLIVNSRNLCGGKARAAVRLAAQNGRRRGLRPVVRATACKKQRRAKRSAHKRR